MEISDVLERAATYLGPDKLQAIREAYEFAEMMHRGQTRKTGDPYITHPVEVSYLVAGLELDHNAISAAFLHDVQEDCGVSNEEISRRFGPEVARMVDGLTKLENLPAPALDGYEPRDALQAHNLRKMFLTMAEDMTVVLIKLCDRLHNMRTLWAHSEEKQRRIARETMDIYAPLASRLGVFQFKWELEDLAFRYLEPDEYRRIARLLDLRREQRERYVQQAIHSLERFLDHEAIEAEVTGRAKHIFSIHQKMKRYARLGKSFDQIYDLLAVRVLVETIQQCYSVLGHVHSLWRPIPGEFDDYIANPKETMYQSLHTTVIGPGGMPLEIQIRTREMHRLSEYGVAAHWRYKEGGRHGQDEERMAWLRQLIEWQRDLSGAEEFVETVKTDIFRDQVFVYTPKGDVLDLPAGSTPLDFAYRIHTELGHQTVGAKVNGRMVTLTHELQNGDVIEIVRSRASRGPSRDWLNPHNGYLRTSHARAKVRQWLRRQQRTESLDRGREMLAKEAKRVAIDPSEYGDEILKAFNYRTWDDLLAGIGHGDISAQAIIVRAERLLREHSREDAFLPIMAEPAPPVGPEAARSLRVLGMSDMLTNVGQCCNPVPGDPIVGYVTRSRGVTVHRADCHNVLNEREPERLVDVEWVGRSTRSYPVPVRIDAVDRVGLLRDISNLVTEENVNMFGVRTTEPHDGLVSIFATLQIADIEQLLRLFARIEMLRSVKNIVRVADGARAKVAAAAGD